jgi:hypothetical protein
MSLSTDQRVNMSLDDLIKAKSSEARPKKGKKVGAAKPKTLVANVNKAAGSAERRARKRVAESAARRVQNRGESIRNG